MYFKTIAFLSLLLFANILFGQSSAWKGIITRADGNKVVFNFILSQKNGKPQMVISNADEKIKVSDIHFKGDSVFIKMPIFESAFRAKIGKSEWNGVWIKGTSSVDQILPFTAIQSSKRFDPVLGNAKYNLSGRWKVNFANDKSDKDASIAEFKQTGNKITGTFLTPSGDYRYQEGIVTGNKMMLSGFDGGHAFLFTADIMDNKTISNGMYYSGAKYAEGFKGVKDPNATVSTDEVSMNLNPGEQKLNFSFPDLNGNKVSINDPRFRNKVVIIQIMGSWCPNCMDETAFLSQFYKNNKQRGIEILGLAYEYSNDFKRSVNSLSKFKNKFDVQYPLLITGVTVNDPQRTEKTLPQVSPIKVFPSTIFLDKKGNVRKFDTGFFGPGTGGHYDSFKKEFNEIVDGLLKE